MTRRSSKSRTASQEAVDQRSERPGPHQRRRRARPAAFWFAVIGAAVLVLSTMASLVRVFL